MKRAVLVLVMLGCAIATLSAIDRRDHEEVYRLTGTPIEVRMEVGYGEAWDAIHSISYSFRSTDGNTYKVEFRGARRLVNTDGPSYGISEATARPGSSWSLATIRFSVEDYNHDVVVDTPTWRITRMD